MNPGTSSYPAGTHPDTHIPRTGTIESTKIEDNSEIVTIKGAFRMEENIRLYTGAVAVSSVYSVGTGGSGSDGDSGISGVGSLVGPFGKLGKCKVKFEVGQAGSVGDVVTVYTLK